MSNLAVDGFATYGTGVGSSTFNTEPVPSLLAGIYADTGTHSSSLEIILGHLPWDATDTDFWLSVNASSYYLQSIGLRRVLPTTANPVIFSCYMALNALPSADNRIGPVRFADGTNTNIASVYVGNTGTLTVDYGGGTLTTSGPVFVAEATYHVEMKMDNSSGTFVVYVDGTQVINGSGLSFTNTNACAQYKLPIAYYNEAKVFISHTIVRDTTGSYNNDITGDRKVATLTVNADDAAQGWEVNPIHRFGTGVLDLTAAGASVLCGATTDTDIGSGDFTLEGQFRFQTLPTGSDKAVLFGKWDEANDDRSYQLYIGGPSLNSGETAFRTSTDGMSGTVAIKASWDWEPVVGHWYHVALVRESGDVSLFIDGVRLGTAFSTAETAYASGAYACLGAQTNAAAVVSNTYFDGWQDEFRLTVGTARYSANFTAPTTAFDRNGSDANWADVALLMSWDNSTVTDDGPLTLTLTAKNSADTLTPDDGTYGYQVLDKASPDDDSFIDAALIPATGYFTMTALPSNTETVTVATKSGGGAAVYTFKTTLASAYDVLIGASIADTAANLAAAINQGTGEGSTYGTGTVANADVTADVNPSAQVVVTAITPGTAGNSLASTETCANASWGASTLEDGANIPGYSQFGFERMPAGTTVVDSVTLLTRQWKNDAGTVNTQASFVGGGGAVGSGSSRVVSTTPTFYTDTIEEDPDTSAGLTPTSILNGLVRMNRTA